MDSAKEGTREGQARRRQGLTGNEPIPVRAYLEEKLQHTADILLLKLDSHRENDKLIHEAERDVAQKATSDLNRRLDDMNKFREQIQQERAEFLTREIYEREHKNLENKGEKSEADLNKRLTTLELTRSNLEGRLWMLGALVSVVTVMVNAALRYLWR